MALSIAEDQERTTSHKKHGLGIVQLRHHETNAMLMIPTPSNDCNDPLNWSTMEKYYVFGVICFGAFLVNFVVAGLSVALEQLTIEFFGTGPESPEFLFNLNQASYFQTACALMVGVGNLWWVPLAIKYGRRPVYSFSMLFLEISSLWCAVADSFGSLVAARVLQGTASAALEIVAPLILTDIFFLHERGSVMVLYTCALSCGVGFGVVISGVIMIRHSWRVIYWLCTAMSAVCAVSIAIYFPETHFLRQKAIQQYGSLRGTSFEASDSGDTEKAHVERVADLPTEPPPRMTFLQQMKPFSGTYTSESLLTLAYRPIIALTLPAVLWATLINSITIGSIVLISSNFSSAFSTTYGFATWQSGLTYLSTIIGSLIAIFSGGHFSDWVADKLTKKNNGIRTPEMRLPSLTISLITAPLSCILYGFGLGKELHWICAVFGIGLVNFTTVQSNNISLVYILDSYRPISGEVVVTQAVFKSAFGFLLSFYANTWIQKQGYINVFGTVAGISVAVFICLIPFYLWGNRMRHATWKWAFIRKTLHWNPDREVGE